MIGEKYVICWPAEQCVVKISLAGGKEQSRGLTLRSSAHRHWGDDPPLFRFIFSQPLGVSETCCGPRTMFDPQKTIIQHHLENSLRFPMNHGTMMNF
jgi:hypothetical protein